MAAVLKKLAPLHGRLEGGSVSGRKLSTIFPEIGSWQLSILLSKMVELGLLEIASGKELQGSGKAMSRTYAPTDAGMAWSKPSDSSPEADAFMQGVGAKWRRVPTELVGHVKRSDRGVYETATFVRMRGEEVGSS